VIQKHTEFYNNKSNRMLRLKDKDNPDGAYRTYTPNELYDDTDKSTLTRLYSNKESATMKQNKAGAKEDSIQVGDTVRIVDMAKRKGELTKGFKISWSRELYTVHKIKRPIPSEDSKPTKFFVKDKDTGKARTEPFTINDLQLIRGDVQKAPDSIQVTDKDKPVTRSKKDEPPTDPPTQPAEPSAPPPKAPTPPKAPKPKATPKDDPLLGKRVRSWVDVQVGKSGTKMKEVVVYGTVVNKQKRKKGWYYKIQWAKDKYSGQYDWKEFEYKTRQAVTKQLVKPLASS
jgi:hypothetical protein